MVDVLLSQTLGFPGRREGEQVVAQLPESGVFVEKVGMDVLPPAAAFAGVQGAKRINELCLSHGLRKVIGNSGANFL